MDVNKCTFMFFFQYYCVCKEHSSYCGTANAPGLEMISSGKDGGPWLSHTGSSAASEGGPGPCSVWKAEMSMRKDEKQFI